MSPGCADSGRPRSRMMRVPFGGLGLDAVAADLVGAVVDAGPHRRDLIRSGRIFGLRLLRCVRCRPAVHEGEQPAYVVGDRSDRLERLHQDGLGQADGLIDARRAYGMPRSDWLTTRLTAHRRARPRPRSGACACRRASQRRCAALCLDAAQQHTPSLASTPLDQRDRVMEDAQVRGLSRCVTVDQRSFDKLDAIWALVDPAQRHDRVDAARSTG
jgi:hypothetical protein